MTEWVEVKKIRDACHDQWREGLSRLQAMGVSVRPWPSAGEVAIDVSELPVDPERPQILARALRRFDPRGIVQCHVHVELFPLYKSHELAPGNYEDRKQLNPEETVREWVKRMTNEIVQECDRARTSQFFVRCPPTVGFPRGDDYGNWMVVLLLGAPSPVADRLTTEQVDAAIESLRDPEA